MNLSELKAPFPENEIEWRLAQCGKKGNGQIWAMCLAYVQARAIMTRLDEVCGPENWKVSYRVIPASQGLDAGVICELSIKIGDAWITKEDGAEQTDIESFKGGISSALKRAAVPWGIGRYLYGLDQGFAQIVDKGGRYGRLKEKDGGNEFYWEPPALPQWALPEGQKSKALPKVIPQQPAAGDGVQDFDPVITFGKKYTGKRFSQVGPKELGDYVAFLEDSVKQTGKPLTAGAKSFIESVTHFIASWENGQ